MNEDNQKTSQKGANFFLDITPETCPMTFVRTKLVLEKMAPVDIAEVRLQAAEPLENVPQAVLDMGHEVVSFEPEAETTTNDGIHRLIIRKKS